MYTCSGISWKSFLETREMEKALLSVRSSLAKNLLEFRAASRMMASPRRNTTISARFFIGSPSAHHFLKTRVFTLRYRNRAQTST